MTPNIQSMSLRTIFKGAHARRWAWWTPDTVAPHYMGHDWLLIQCMPSLKKNPGALLRSHLPTTFSAPGSNTACAKMAPRTEQSPLLRRPSLFLRSLAPLMNRAVRIPHHYQRLIWMPAWKLCTIDLLLNSNSNCIRPLIHYRRRFQLWALELTGWKQNMMN